MRNLESILITDETLNANVTVYFKNISLTDEACLTRRAINNTHNELVNAIENSHTIKVTNFQHEFNIKVQLEQLTILLLVLSFFHKN